MPQSDLEKILADLPRVGTLVKDDAGRQLWRFEWSGKPYYLRFHPRGGLLGKIIRRFRSGPAASEFVGLQMLQKAGIPSPRAVALLIGFRLADRRGDAVIVEGIEPSMTLDRYLNNCALAGNPAPDHHALSVGLADLVGRLGQSKLSHRDLRLSQILVKEGKLYLLGGRAVRRGGLQIADVMLLEHSARGHATKPDLLRTWRRLDPDSAMPDRNRIGRRLCHSFASRACCENEQIGRLNIGAWRGFFFKRTESPERWSMASHMRIDPAGWMEAWPILLGQVESDQFEILKRDESGDVLAGEIVLGGRPVPVVVKRPRRRFWYRYLNEIGRGSRVRRAWKKSWALAVRRIPTAWPLLMMERRCCGYVTDAMIVFEQVPGRTLAETDLASLGDEERDLLLRRAGRLLRRLENSGLHLYDAKATNWMVTSDEKLGPLPLLIDVDGLRLMRRSGGGVARLLRSLRQHPQFRESDEQSLKMGYDPYKAQETR